MKKNLPIFLLSSALLTAETIPSDCPRGPHPSLVNAKHLEYQGIGFDEGYSTLQFFWANGNPFWESNFLFLDLRGHLFNDGRPACNAGFGWRKLFDSFCSSFGLNAYYDFRHTKRNNYHQTGIGAEFLTPRWELRANGYFPFGSKVSPIYALEFSHFDGNTAFVSRKHEFSMIGADLEAGCHVMRWKHCDLFIAAGPYAFKGKYGKTAAGGKLRLEGRITPYVTIEIGDSYDQVFKNRFHTELTLSLSFGPRTKPNPEKQGSCSCDDQIALQQWLHQPPNRGEIIVVDEKKKTSPAIDPATGAPIFFLFVNNLSSSNGTIQSPYSSLATAEANSAPGDIIYVFPGDGTSANMDMGILLKPNQRFLGSGVSHGIDTTLGSLSIPPQSSSFPTITNVNVAPIVTLSTGNEVAGFSLLGGAGMQSISGVWTNVVTTTNINRNQIYFFPGTGIELIPTNTQIDIQISGNDLFTQPGMASGIGIDCGYQMDSSGTVSIQNNSIQFLNNIGIRMIHTDSVNVVSNISRNFINNVANESIQVNANGAALVAQTNVSNNTIFARQQMINLSVIHLLTQSAAQHTSNILDNRIEQPLTPSFTSITVEADSTALGNTNTTISRNTIRGGNTGIRLLTTPTSAGPLQAYVSGNYVEKTVNIPFLTFGLPGAINIYSRGAGSVDARVVENTVDDCGVGGTGIGFFLDSQESTMLTSGAINVDLSRNNFTRCRTSAIYVDSPNFAAVGPGPNARLNISSNHSVENGSFGSATHTLVVNPAFGNWTVDIYNNHFSKNFPGDMFIGSGDVTVTICLKINQNQTDDAIAVSNSAMGVFNLELPENNSSGYSIDPPVTIVPPGSCN